jgi:hypothetical protein
MAPHRQPPVTGIVVVVEDAQGGTVHVFELARLERPEEGDQPDQAEAEGRWNEDAEDVHALASQRANRRRRALRVTRIEDDDMATAAISGVTRPATAIGTAIVL